jgi:hypothetical protein
LRRYELAVATLTPEGPVTAMVEGAADDPSD